MLHLNASSNGGDASRVGKRCSYYLVEDVLPCFLCPDARRVAPIRASVGCLSLSQNGIIRQHKTQAQNASSNGGDASRVGKDAAII